LLNPYRKAHPGEQTRQQPAGGIIEHASHLDGAGIRIDAVVGEVDLALEGEIRIGGQPEENRGIAVAGGQWLLFTALFKFQQIAFVDVEVNVHRRGIDDGGQQGLFRGADQVAHIHQTPADTAADGGSYLSVGQIQARRLNSGPRCIDGGPRLIPQGLGLDDFHLADGLILKRALLAFQRGFGQAQFRLPGRQVGPGFVEPGLIGSGIDGEQQIALLDLGGIGKVQLLEIAFDPGPDFHRFHRVRLTGVLGIVGDVLALGQGHGNRRRRRCDKAGLLPATRQKNGRCRGQKQDAVKNRSLKPFAILRHDLFSPVLNGGH